MKKMNTTITRAMSRFADSLGSPLVFLAAVILIVGWFVAMRWMEYDVWFDIMDVTIFLTTFLFLFMLQSAQNADTQAIQDKLDDLIKALPNTDKDKVAEEEKLKRGEKQIKN